MKDEILLYLVLKIWKHEVTTLWKRVVAADKIAGDTTKSLEKREVARREILGSIPVLRRTFQDMLDFCEGDDKKRIERQWLHFRAIMQEIERKYREPIKEIEHGQ